MTNDKRVLWDGTPEEFWNVINRYIARQELEADWSILNEVLELALLNLTPATLNECCAVVAGQGTDQTESDVPSAESD
jgi:hypothetical protein